MIRCGPVQAPAARPDPGEDYLRERRTSAPAAPTGFLIRPRLDAAVADLPTGAALAAIAPAGYGKTQLLAHWRRQRLAMGENVAWMKVDPDGRIEPDLLHLALDRAEVEGGGGSNGLAAAIKRIARAARPVTLIIDGADEATGALAVLAEDPPANCRLLIGLRRATSDAPAACLTTNDLRFTAAESIAFLQQRLGEGMSKERLLGLAELADGWPFALELAACEIGLRADRETAARQFDGSSGLAADYFQGVVLQNLNEAERKLLSEAAILDELAPGLLEAVSQRADAMIAVRRCEATTPFFVREPGAGGPRFHRLARQFLLASGAEFGASAPPERHERAADWLVRAGAPARAAPHAFNAGRRRLATDLVETSLIDVACRGELSRALEWLGRIPPEEIAAREELRFGAALTIGMAGFELARRAPGLEAATLLALLDPDQRAVVEMLLAWHVDDWDAVVEAKNAVRDVSSLPTPFAVSYANFLRWIAAVSGAPDPGPVGASDETHAIHTPSLFYSRCFGIFRTSESLISEGRATEALKLLTPLVEQCDRALGWLSAPSIATAPLAAAAHWQAGSPAAAEAVLAGRLASIERYGHPEGLWLAFSTAARIAGARGDLGGCLEMLDRLESAAQERGLHRIVTLCHAERVKAYARAGRSSLAAAGTEKLEQLVAQFGGDHGLRAPAVRLAGMLGLACAHRAAGRRMEAAAAAREAEEIAERFSLRRDIYEARLWRRLIIGDGPDEMQRLAKAWLRNFDRADLLQLFVDLGAEPPGMLEPERSSDAQAAAPEPAVRLTPKEIDVLKLLEQGLSNKLIARALNLSDETVKWHLKNLFAKLDAHDRRHVVEQARRLGLLSFAFAPG